MSVISSNFHQSFGYPSFVDSTNDVDQPLNQSTNQSSNQSPAQSSDRSISSQSPSTPGSVEYYMQNDKQTLFSPKANKHSTNPSINRTIDQSDYGPNAYSLAPNFEYPSNNQSSSQLFLSTNQSNQSSNQSGPLSPPSPAHVQSLTRFLRSSFGSSLLISRLVGGSILLHHADSSMIYRFVQFDQNDQAINWYDLNQTPAKPAAYQSFNQSNNQATSQSHYKLRGSVSINSIVSVIEGSQSTNQSNNQRFKISPSFSILYNERPKHSNSQSIKSIDFECVSNEDRDLWMVGIMFLINQSNNQSPNQSAMQSPEGSPKVSLMTALELLCDTPVQSINQSMSSISEISPMTMGSNNQTNNQTMNQSTPPSSFSFSPSHQRTRSNSQSVRGTPVRVNRFEVTDIVTDEDDQSNNQSNKQPFVDPFQLSDPAAPQSIYQSINPSHNQTIDPSSNQTINQLNHQLSLYRSDARRLLLCHAKKMMQLQSEIDQLQSINQKLLDIQQRNAIKQTINQTYQSNNQSNNETNNQSNNHQMF